jgi:hypothetical protein
MTEQEKETVLDEVVNNETVDSKEKVEDQPQPEPEVVEDKATTIDEDGTIKVDLRKFNNQQDAVSEQETNAVDADQPTGDSEEVVEEVSQQQESVQDEEQQVVEEVTNEEIEDEVEALSDEVEEAVAEAEEKGIDLPENIQKVVDFINETGGTLEDYVSLNKNYNDIDDIQVLKEYYKKEKPYLDEEDINLLMEDFSFDESLDDEKTVKKAKLAFKEEVNKARKSLELQKNKYYEEIKAGSKLTSDQQKAVDFFNRYNKESEEASKVAKKQTDVFLDKTGKVFNDKFKGFEYNVGEKRFRFNVKNANEVKQAQSDINNFVKKFLTEDNTMGDARGYHKALFTAMNADAIANHFYEQGKADAIKDSISKSKNVDMKPRGVHEKTADVGGMKVRVITGDDSSSLRVKMRK